MKLLLALLIGSMNTFASATLLPSFIVGTWTEATRAPIAKTIEIHSNLSISSKFSTKTWSSDLKNQVECVLLVKGDILKVEKPSMDLSRHNLRHHKPIPTFILTYTSSTIELLGSNATTDGCVELTNKLLGENFTLQVKELNDRAFMSAVDGSVFLK